MEKIVQSSVNQKNILSAVAILKLLTVKMQPAVQR